MTSVGGHETVVPKQEQMTMPLIDDDERHIRQATLLMTLNCSTPHHPDDIVERPPVPTDYQPDSIDGLERHQ